VQDDVAAIVAALTPTPTTTTTTLPPSVPCGGAVFPGCGGSCAAGSSAGRPWLRGRRRCANVAPPCRRHVQTRAGRWSRVPAAVPARLVRCAQLSGSRKPASLPRAAASQKGPRRASASTTRSAEARVRQALRAGPTRSASSRAPASDEGRFRVAARRETLQAPRPAAATPGWCRIAARCSRRRNAGIPCNGRWGAEGPAGPC
jgi:hypothetical protein